MNRKIDLILSTFGEMFPNAKIELNHRNHFELLIAVVLSAQTTDVSINKITPALFTKFPTPQAMMDASLNDIEQTIKSIGLYRNKAKNIQLLATKLVTDYHAVVPNNREDLESLPGVGRKTANVVLSQAFGVPALAVDTHVARVSKRLGLAKKEDSVVVIERKLNKIIPKKYWNEAHHQFIFFGRYHCLAQKPKCQNCPLFEVCTYENKQHHKNNH